MTAVAIIPARGGSRRIPRKNIRPFFGKPMLAYSIEVAQDSALFHRVYVSTEDEEIAKIAEQHQAIVIWRNAVLAQDSVGTQQVMYYALKELRPIPDLACCIYPCAPLLQPSDLWRAYAALTSGHDYAISVGANPLRDAGAFYFGKSDCFMRGDPLVSNQSAMIALPDSRVCDVNTEADWQECARLYAQMNGLQEAA